MAGSLKICLLEPWYGGSHRRWVDGLKDASRHGIDLLALPARHWKWRMHGAAVTFARQFIEAGRTYDLILANDMMDVAVFKALVGASGIDIPIACYFHENQISYPVSPRDTDITASRDLHYGYINYTTALAADVLYFNSQYHRDNFIGLLPEFLSGFPDFRGCETVVSIAEKAKVLPLGMNLMELNEFKPGEVPSKKRPLLLWNHRWEFDKRPEAFLQMVLELDRMALEFDLALLGERGQGDPASLDEVRLRLGTRLLQEGRVEDSATYAQWLWRADILPVTSVHDFFGGSVVEAIYCGCHPVLPNRLSYPEHVKDTCYLYEGEKQMVQKVAHLIRSGQWRKPAILAPEMLRYDWSQLSDCYDSAFSMAVDRE